MNMERLGIKKQVLYLILACSLTTLLVAGGVALYGMMTIKADAVAIGLDIGEKAADKSSEDLKAGAESSMQIIVLGRAGEINRFFGDFRNDVLSLADEMNLITQNAADYSPQKLRRTTARNKAGKIFVNSQYANAISANNPAVQHELAMSANVQDFLLHLNKGDTTTASTYVVSQNGFMISADTVPNQDEFSPQGYFDYRQRPWYQKAVQSGAPVFSEVFADSDGRGLALSCSAPYYNANGEIAGVVGEGKLLADINQLVLDTTFGETGFAFTLNNKTGQVIFSPKTDGAFGIDYDNNLDNDPSLFDYEEKSLAEVAKKMAAGEKGFSHAKFDGKNYYVSYAPIENTSWSFGMAIEESEVIAPAERNRQETLSTTYGFVENLNGSIKHLLVAIFLVFFAVVFFAVFAARKIADKFTRPLLTLSDGVREIACGNFEKKIEIHTGNEIEHLAVCFNAMTDELKAYIDNLSRVTAEKEKAAAELNIARNIQIGALPQDFLTSRKEFEIYATMDAAKGVGGDFYDFYMTDENHLAVTIADVSGKGVPAALYMMRAKTTLKNLVTMANAPDDFAAVMTLANQELCRENETMMFVTVFFAQLDLMTGEVIYVNAGHNPPVLSENGNFRYLTQKKKHMMLGVNEDATYEAHRLTLSPGDMLFLYTDGVTEAMDSDKNLYSEERLAETLNHIDGNISVRKILAEVRKDIDAHADGAEQSDDITMLGLIYKGKSTLKNSE